LILLARTQKLSDEEVKLHLEGLKGWKVDDGMLQKRFKFKGFMAGMRFVNQVAEVAEEMDHHPDIYIRFGLITISLITHSAQGLTKLDFEQATRVDASFDQSTTHQ